MFQTLTLLFLLLSHLSLSQLSPFRARRPSDTRSQETGVGINCAGSSQCSFTTVNSPNILREFNSTLYTNHGTRPDSLPALPALVPLPDLELFYKHEHIICARNLEWLIGSICIFLQGEKIPKDGVPGFMIKRLVNDLALHIGCLDE
ncbi:MAG: hypothetical protein Q9221_001911 [Calogaya cf. arnoldii]